MRLLIGCNSLICPSYSSSDRHKLKHSRLAQYWPQKTSAFDTTMKRYSTTDMQASTSTHKSDSMPTVVDLTHSDSDDEVVAITSSRVTGALYEYISEEGAI